MPSFRIFFTCLFYLFFTCLFVVTLLKSLFMNMLEPFNLVVFRNISSCLYNKLILPQLFLVGCFCSIRFLLLSCHVCTIYGNALSSSNSCFNISTISPTFLHFLLPLRLYVNCFCKTYPRALITYLLRKFYLFDSRIFAVYFLIFSFSKVFYVALNIFNFLFKNILGAKFKIGNVGSTEGKK